MHLASILCFCAASVQVLVGVLLVLCNMPASPFGVSFGVPVWVPVGGVLCLTGMATYLAGGVVGFMGMKREGASDTTKVFMALNGAALGFLVLVCAAGMALQTRQAASHQEALARYEHDRNDQRLKFAEAFAHTYHQQLWDRHILLLNTRLLSTKMGSTEIGGVTLVVVPTIDWQTDKPGDRLLDGNDYFLHLFVRKLLEANDSAGFAALKTYLDDSSISYGLDLEEADGGFKTLHDREFDWLAKRDLVIKRITAKLEFEDKYRKDTTP